MADEPSSPKKEERQTETPRVPWEEERKQMAELIRVQTDLLFKYRKQNEGMRAMIEQQNKKLKELSEPAENLEDEFTVCKENIKFSDVGGLEPVVDKIRYFEYGIQYPKMYEMYAIRPPRGLLLHGPPGCGKTMLAKAISNELDCFFLEVPITRVISKWVGEAEKTLESILRKCNEVYQEKGRKVLVFVDEAEQMFKKRGESGDHGVIDRCVNVWLRYMDGMADGEGLIYVAATNKPDLMDDAIKRAGRFDHIIEIPLPDRTGVEDILRKQMTYKERMANRDIYQISDLTKLSDALYRMGANGADIAEILRITSERQIKMFIERDPSEQIKKSETYIYENQLEATAREYAGLNRREEKRVSIGFMAGK